MRTFFDLEGQQTAVRDEIVGGATTFMTMAYILVVNPQILSAAGLPFDAVLFATAAASGVATLVMALWARYPIALAPGMGLNAYFAFTVVPQLTQTLGSQERAWAAALGAVFISGALFLLLSLVKLREAMVNAVPSSLKLAISGGIGLFIALIGFQHGEVVRAHPQTLVTLGALDSARPLLTLAGVVLMATLMARNVRSAGLLAIALVSLAALLLGDAPDLAKLFRQLGSQVVHLELPTAIASLPDPRPTLLALDIPGALSAGLVTVVFAFFFVDLFDTIGTLIGVAEQGGFMDDQGRLPRVSRALLADAIGTLLGSLLGTSTVTSYIESASGIAAGARTGLASVVTAGLFFLSILFAPLLRAIPRIATAPVLIVVGALMVSNSAKIHWDDPSEGIPAFLTISGIAFTYSIADGMALGFVSYALIKLLAGKARDLNPMMWTLAGLFALRYALLG